MVISMLYGHIFEFNIAKINEFVKFIEIKGTIIEHPQIVQNSFEGAFCVDLN